MNIIYLHDHYGSVHLRSCFTAKKGREEHAQGQGSFGYASLIMQSENSERNKK